MSSLCVIILCKAYYFVCKVHVFCSIFATVYWKCLASDFFVCLFLSFSSLILIILLLYQLVSFFLLFHLFYKFCHFFVCLYSFDIFCGFLIYRYLCIYAFCVSVRLSVCYMSAVCLSICVYVSLPVCVCSWLHIRVTFCMFVYASQRACADQMHACLVRASSTDRQRMRCLRVNLQ